MRLGTTGVYVEVYTPTDLAVTVILVVGSSCMVGRTLTHTPAKDPAPLCEKETEATGRSSRGLVQTISKVAASLVFASTVMGFGKEHRGYSARMVVTAVWNAVDVVRLESSDDRSKDVWMLVRSAASCEAVRRRVMPAAAVMLFTSTAAEERMLLKSSRPWAVQTAA